MLSVLSIAGSGYADFGERPPPLPLLQSLAIRVRNDPYATMRMLHEFYGLLDGLCSIEMVEVLRRFSALRDLRFTLYDDKPEHVQQWWEAQLATRLSGRLRSAISVSVTVLKSRYLVRSFPHVTYDRVAQLTLA